MFKKKFKLGLFAFNASSGSTITNHKKKWKMQAGYNLKKHDKLLSSFTLL